MNYIWFDTDKLTADSKIVTSVTLTEEKFPKSTFPYELANPETTTDNNKVVSAQLFTTDVPVKAFRDTWRQVLVFAEEFGNQYWIGVFLTHNGKNLDERGPFLTFHISRSKQIKATVRSLFYSYGVDKVNFQ